jgi:hypothetical protein
METATATAHESQIEAAETRVLRQKSPAECRRNVIDGHQREGQKSPVNEGMRQAGEWALLDYLPLQHDFPEKLPDPRPQRRYLEIRRGARTADHLQDLTETPPEQRQGSEENYDNYGPFHPRCVGHMQSVLNVACGPDVGFVRMESMEGLCE